jgi:signal transduction histidine kinase/DNA-binding response OmpR family regulator/ligand-binding sensor domain-containing protein
MHKPFTWLKIIFTFAILLWPGFSATAQKTSGYETISTDKGLSQGMIFDILQDKEGFIWVATKNGLNRYDGYSFKVFSNDPYNAYSLSSNTIIKLFEDSKGRIWVGTEDAGLNVYDKKSGRFIRIQHKPADAASISGNAIRSFAELPGGKIIVAVYGAGFNVIDMPDDVFEKPAAPAIVRLKLPNNTDVYGMGKDKNGNIWIGGFDKSVYRFDTAKNTFLALNSGVLLNDGYITKGGEVISSTNYFLWDGTAIYPLFDTAKIPAGNILLRPKQSLWRNHYREILAYDITRREAGKPLQWDMQFPDSVRVLFPFMIDRSGIVWSGSMGYGLRKYNTAGSKFNQHLLAGYSVRWIKAGKANTIYTGDFGYNWIKLDEQGIEKNPFHKFPQLSQVDNFLISKTGKYWFKSEAEGYKGYYDYDPVSGSITKHFTFINEVSGDKQPMLEDSKGYIWFSVRGGLFRRIDTNTGNIDSFSINVNNVKQGAANIICTALYQDGQGIYWIGTQDGFAKVQFNNVATAPTVKWYYNTANTRNSLNYNHVSCFMDDPSAPGKYLWICTKGGGLNRMNKITGDFFHLTTKHGLPDDVLYGILPDEAKNIWGSSNNGIFCLLANPTHDSSRWEFRNFTKAYGLQGDEFNTGAYAKLPNGNLAFGGVNGLNIFNPAAILTTGFTPNVFISSILINNTPVIAGDETGVLQNNIETTQSISLNYLQDILTLEFSSLDFTASAQNKYRYQLVGIDKDWVESGTRRTATYLHLPSGKYIFKVQGSNSQGIWSDKIDELQITVLPPWWRSWWAYLCYIVLLALCIRAYLKFNLNRAKLKAQLSFEQLEAKRVKELDTVKTQLYTNITHEFRTPLTVILGMAQQVKNNPPAHLENGMDMIIRNGQNLLNLVNEMLDLSKLETGKMQLQLVNGDVINFLRYIVESFQSLAESQQKQLHFLAAMDALYIAYDPEKLRQIVANLLSNALKFTPEKGNIYISVSESAAANNEQYATLIIKVKDTGIGIPESQLQHIFDRFYQLDNSLTRKTEGTGIGLALTRELVKLMEGEITVKSPPTGANKGSEFTVALPFKKLLATEEAITPPDIRESYLQKTTTGATTTVTIADEKQQQQPLILLVEDNADVVAYTASCLPDYRLAVGKDGREGFEIAAEIIPDLIITDVMMPFVDGFELCRRLRKEEHTSHIPIIMLTAKAGIESKMEGLQQGADVYLEKPFNREELLIRIKKLLELRQNLQQYYLKKAGLTTAAPEVIVAEEVIAENKIEDAFVKKIREAVEIHLTETNFTIEQLCKLVFMSHSQLHRKLDALTGCSPNKFIRIIRLNKAKALLQQPSASIATVALECGYSDPGYFARVFKQEYGVTPQEWRAIN